MSTRAPLVAVVLLLAGALAPAAVLGFDGFGEATADATYGDGIEFEVALDGGAPDELELLLRFGDTEVDFVAPVSPAGDTARYVFDTQLSHVVPNTLVTYRWRATEGDAVTVSDPQTVRYDDDRFEWQSREIGETTVHWYGDGEARALAMGELSGEGAARAEALLGHELTQPVDLFVYESRTEFFGALGPGAREWTGAAAYPELRTVFLYLQGNSDAYLELATVHEVAHVVFHDATDNPFHEPARWINEGIASWSELQHAETERAMVEREASSDRGLLAFEAITRQFPIDDRGGRLAYSQGATMIDMIVSEYGTEALSRLTAAYRAGASDEEALEAASGRPAEELYAQFFASFGVEVPQPIAPEPLLPSNVELPGGGALPSAGPTAATPPPRASPGEVPGVDHDGWLVLVPLTLAAVAALGAAAFFSARAGRRAGERS